jgi:hypothetical protein
MRPITCASAVVLALSGFATLASARAVHRAQGLGRADQAFADAGASMATTIAGWK